MSTSAVFQNFTISFQEIAIECFKRNEKRILPILIGAKNPAIKWKHLPIYTASKEDWAQLASAWAEDLSNRFPTYNVAVVAKPFEMLFIDEDFSREFRVGYESFSGEVFPKTYTTSARDNRAQSHWLQTDATRLMGNVTQDGTVSGWISVRQNNLYVLAAGSQHKNGIDFYKVIDPSPIVPMPDKLVEYISSLRKDKTINNEPEKKVDGWINTYQLVHPGIDDGLVKLAGHYIQNDNIKNPDILYTLLEKHCESAVESFDGVTPFECDMKRVREIANDKVKTWKTGAEKRTELVLNQTPVVLPSPAFVVPETVERYAISEEQKEAEYEKEYPVIPLVEQAGPFWSNDIMYGIAGEITTMACEYCEAHPAGMYLDLLIALGSIIGRGPYFNINSTRHYTNEFLARVGPTSEGRKGTGRDVIDAIVRMVDPLWHQNRIMSGFGSAEAIINEIRDTHQQSVVDKKSLTGFKTVTVPGVDDKRLCIREGELASVFQLAGKRESRADIILRDGFDGKAIRNLVKGKSREGLSNSATCMEPHISISGDTTRSELLKKMPPGSDENGFGNRFLYCYVFRTKVCPNGGPEIDWSEIIPRLYDTLQNAKEIRYVPLNKPASKVWGRMYTALDEPANKLQGFAGTMTARSAPHIRRLALILALLDDTDIVDTRHLHAAKKLWDYCQESAKFIFTGSTTDQDKIVQHLFRTPATASEIRREVFHSHKRAEWVEAQLVELVQKDRAVKYGVRLDAATGKFWYQQG